MNTIQKCNIYYIYHLNYVLFEEESRVIQVSILLTGLTSVKRLNTLKLY